MSTTARVQCRFCKADIESVPSYLLPNAPAGAQWLPGADKVSEDKPVSLDIRQCAGCGLIQLKGDPVIYYEDITSVTRYSAPMMAHRRRQAEEFTARFNLKGKKMLEVGCGDGFFLKILEELGVRATGIEPSRKAGGIGSREGSNILEGYVREGSPVPGSPYDAFATFHVMEHVPDPNSFLRGIAASLAERGVGLIEVPSAEQILERRRFYDFLNDHLTYFTQDTLAALLRSNGFEVMDIFRNWDGEHLVAYARKAGSSAGTVLTQAAKPNGDLAWIPESVESLKRSLESFVRERARQGKKTAIWGASHHSLTLLGVTGVRGFQYVIDSAPAKQGRLTPVSHLPIVSPEALKTDPVDAVVVIAPRYDKEILEQLRKECRFKGDVAVVHDHKLTPVSLASSLDNDPEFLKRLYEKMYLIRHIDELVKEEYSSRNIRGPVHLSVGQEAIAVGVLAACRPSDICVGTHRDHAPYLAKGGDAAAMIDELYGLSTGCSKGLGGSMHLFDKKAGFMGASAVVGGSIPVSAGIALALKKDGKGGISIGFTGDGATDEGVFYETLNLAALLRLPLLLVVENNGLSTLSPLTRRQASTDIVGKAKSMGVEGVQLDGNDVMTVYEHARRAVDYIRREGKPYLIEAVTVRLCAHVGPVVFTSGQIGADEEMTIKLKQEPLKVFRERHPEFEKAREEVEEKVRKEVRKAFESAKKAFDAENKRKKLPPPPPPQPNRV